QHERSHRAKALESPSPAPHEAVERSSVEHAPALELDRRERDQTAMPAHEARRVVPERRAAVAIAMVLKQLRPPPKIEGTAKLVVVAEQLDLGASTRHQRADARRA